MKKIVADIICGLLILLFAYAAFSKLFAFHRFESVLNEAPLIGNYSILFAVLIPAVELIIVLLLIMPRTQCPGLKAATVLLVVIYSVPGVYGTF